MNNQTTDGVILSVIDKVKRQTSFPADIDMLEGIQNNILELSIQVGNLMGLDKNELCELLNERSKVGIQKYGTTLQDAEISEREIIFHLLTELLDGAGYSEKWLQIIKNKEHGSVKI